MLREVIPQRLHALLVGSRQIHIRNLVKTDEVHPALQALKQLHNLTGVGGSIVESCKSDVLERTTALVGEVVLLEQTDHLSDRHLALGRHQHLALLRQW